MLQGVRPTGWGAAQQLPGTINDALALSHAREGKGPRHGTAPRVCERHEAETQAGPTREPLRQERVRALQRREHHGSLGRRGLRSAGTQRSVT